jgi:hypothetical protein
MRGSSRATPPLSKLAMLTDYITPEQRLVACPNQDVVYGIGLLALDRSPVVIQVPDFATALFHAHRGRKVQYPRQCA